MELAGTSYLYTLAVIATTFSSISALTMIFRQILGGHVTKLDSFVVRTFIQLGFMATAGAMLPPLLALFAVPDATNWRASSTVIAVLLAAWALTFPRRRHAASPAKVPPPVWAVVGMLDLAALALALNAIVAPAELAVAIYAAAVSAILIGGAAFFLLSMIFLFERPIETSQPRPKS